MVGFNLHNTDIYYLVYDTFSDSGGGVATGYFVSSTNPGNNDTIVVNGTDRAPDVLSPGA